MLPIMATIGLIVALVGSVTYLHKKRKQAGTTGIKTALTSICFYLIAIINISAYWFDLLGIVSWGLTVLFLLLGAYFTKYLPRPRETT